MGKDKGAGDVLMREKRDMNLSKPEKPLNWTSSNGGGTSKPRA